MKPVKMTILEKDVVTALEYWFREKVFRDQVGIRGVSRNYNTGEFEVLFEVEEETEEGDNGN